MRLFSIGTLLALSTPLFALKGDSACGAYVCVNATWEQDTVTYQLTSLIEPLGYMAIGFGKNMFETPMIVMWPNSDGSITLSQRFALGHREPLPDSDPPRVAAKVDAKITSWHPENSTTFAFTIPANLTLLASEHTVEPIIWAFSKIRPSKHPDSQLTHHFSAGRMRFDLTKELVVAESPTPNGGTSVADDAARPQTTEQGSHVDDDDDNDDDGDPHGNRLLLIHAVLLSFGFLVVLPTGSLVARWTRSFTPLWFKVHWMLNMGLALPMISLGWVFGPLLVFNHGGRHFSNAHKICGVVLFLLYLAQVALGRYIHKRKVVLQPGSKKSIHPPRNVLHVVLGLSIIGLAFFQIKSGMKKWEHVTGRPVAAWARALWTTWIIVIPFAYFAGLALLRRQARFEALSASASHKEYISLAETSNPEENALVFQVGEDADDDVDEDDDEQMHKPGVESAVPLLQRR